MPDTAPAGRQSRTPLNGKRLLVRKPPAATNGPRWSRIADEIAAQIERGEFADGASLPSAIAVAERYGVHRHTVRQAFRHLQDLGLVSVERGRGTIVQGRRFPYRLGRRVSLRANFGAAGVEVEGRIVDSGMAVADAATAERLAIAEGDPIWVIRTLNLAAGVAVSTGVHRLSVARFPEFDRRLADARVSISAAFATYGFTDYLRLSTRLSARRAVKLEAQLLGLGRGAPVLQSVAVDGLEDGTPLQAIDGAFSADHVEMVIEAEP